LVETTEGIGLGFLHLGGVPSEGAAFTLSSKFYLRCLALGKDGNAGLNVPALPPYLRGFGLDEDVALLLLLADMGLGMEKDAHIYGEIKKFLKGSLLDGCTRGNRVDEFVLQGRDALPGKGNDSLVNDAIQPCFMLDQLQLLKQGQATPHSFVSLIQK
jgi:hypothetical protein